LLTQEIINPIHNKMETQNAIERNCALKQGELVLQMLDLDPANPLSMKEIEKTEMRLRYLYDACKSDEDRKKAKKALDSAMVVLNSAAAIIRNNYARYGHN
jgi:hypothetical protein